MMKKCLFAAWLCALLTAVGSPAASAEEGGAGALAVIRPGGIGTIQRIQGEVVVIDDRCYTVSSSTQYRSADGETERMEGFSRGDRVMFETGSEGDVLLLRKLE